MFPMRLKLGTARNSEWRCCFCLHVRTATILLGIWHLVLHVLALSVLALLMRNHRIVVDNQDGMTNNPLPTPLSKKDDDNPYYLPTTQDGRTIYSSDMDMGALMTVCTLAITLLLVYGAIKGKATHLLPFFCLQLFDFAITTLTATGYFCYLRSVHRFVDENWHNLPYRKQLLQLSPEYLSLIVLAAFLLSMLWKAYCVSIVWRCYKYLTLRQQAMRSTVHYILPDEPPQRIVIPPTELDYGLLRGESETAFNIRNNMMKQVPPPSYQDIMADRPPPYPSSLQLLINNPPDSGLTVADIEEEVLDSTEESDSSTIASASGIATTVVVENVAAGKQDEKKVEEEEKEEKKPEENK